MFEKMIVVDDYYKDPMSVRNYALKCTFKKPLTTKWNGLTSIENHPRSKAVLFDIASQLKLDQKPDWNTVKTSDKFWGRASVGYFALLLHGQKDSIHFHFRTGRWSGVCYLVPEKLCNEKRAITFYKHKKTGLISASHTNEETFKGLKRDLPYKNRWIEELSINMRFNRMVIFDGRYFHKASDGFGTNAVNARLTQLFSFNLSSDL